MRSGSLLCLWLALLGGPAAACGGAAAVAADAGIVDAATAPDAACPIPPGRTYVLREFTLLPSAQGWDLTGDGVVDNMLGNLPQATRDAIHDGMADAFQAGEFLQLVHIGNWSDPPTPTDPDVTFFSMSANDADSPEDPSNNYSGAGRFYGWVSGFDINCVPVTLAEFVSLVDGVLTVRSSSFDFTATAGTGLISFTEVSISGVFTDDYVNLSLTIGANMPFCSLSAIPFPGDIEGTVLDLIVNDPTMAATVTVDADRDGDGLEQVVGDGVSVMQCIDGDGTVIQSRECACDPRMADGYTIGLQFDLITAYVVGLI